MSDGLDARISDRVAQRPCPEGPRGLVRTAGVGGLADPDDCVLVPQVFRCADIRICWQRHGASPSSSLTEASGRLILDPVVVNPRRFRLPIGHGKG